ncbi:hypothetical protein [Xenorhabdus cabanillasii]|uniref:Uncharacterized protein n=1 Tax=Xenorhabdus cabanillasii JM26 TaxID=1427517 RepID=W1IRF0_9GAMM|nr:hypothetical protein [Xenorhabdus cabanillasii]PHM75364.1 hypothetical protein Xcab_04161 [Xenorhabdus cabanillasii JM26]CDL80393.1 conserved hypothetical protein [Xenorhabdus cabanillasii JM26]
MGLDIHFFSGDKQKECADKDVEVGYFRKINSLLYWVSNNVQDVNNCEEILIPKHKLEQLLADLNKLTKDNCPKLFPTADGFYFGSTEYDEDYWSEVEEVKAWVSSVLKSFDFDNYKLFFWAWW